LYELWFEALALAWEIGLSRVGTWLIFVYFLALNVGVLILAVAPNWMLKFAHCNGECVKRVSLYAFFPLLMIGAWLFWLG
jgi:hypothetical protein